MTVRTLYAAELELSKQEQQFLSEHPVITLGTDSHWMPFVVENPDGTLSGYDAEILQQVNRLTGANFQLKAGNWQNMVSRAMNYDIDGLSTSVAQESRRQHLNFSIPYLTYFNHLLVTPENPKNLTSIDNLEGVRIGYQASNLATEKIIRSQSGAVPVAFNSTQALADALHNRQVDAIIGNHSALLIANRMNATGLNIVDTIEGSKIDLVFSIRKDYPEALSILNKALAAIPEQVKQQIYQKWFYYSVSLPPTSSNIALSLEEQHWLLNKPVLRVMAHQQLPPFSFFAEDQTSGFFIDYMRLLASKLGMEVEFITPESWEQGYDMLRRGELDVVPQLSESEQRKSFIDYSASSIISFKSGFAVLKSENSIHSMASLENKVLAVAEDSHVHRVIADNFPEQRLYLSSSTTDSLRAVVSGEADAVFGILPVLEYYIQKNWLSSLKTVEASDGLSNMGNQLRIAVKKGNSVLMTLLEQAQSSITNAEEAELKNQWMNVRPNVEQMALTREEQNYLAEKRRIFMCIDPDWMPFEKNENGRHIGMSADYFELFQEKMNIPIEMAPTDTWLESLELGQSRQCDIFSMVMSTPEREKYLLFTEPYITVPLVIATNISETFIDDITQITDKKIGTVTGLRLYQPAERQVPANPAG